MRSLLEVLLELDAVVKRAGLAEAELSMESAG
jgi:hypothetical protein